MGERHFVWQFSGGRVKLGLFIHDRKKWEVGVVKLEKI